VAKVQTGQKAIRVRKDGRKQLLVYLDAELIKTLKKIAVDQDVNVYDIVEEASQQWLDRQSRGGSGAKRK
jgi:hypothetical protein